MPPSLLLVRGGGRFFRPPCPISAAESSSKESALLSQGQGGRCYGAVFFLRSGPQNDHAPSLPGRAENRSPLPPVLDAMAGNSRPFDAPHHETAEPTLLRF